MAVEAGEKVAEASVDVVIRHRYTLEAVCALNNELMMTESMQLEVLCGVRCLSIGHLQWMDTLCGPS